MSLVIKQTRIVEVPVQSISIAATCQNAHLLDASGMVVGRSLKMPEFVPTLLEIDLATGMIKNWTVPTVAQLQAIADAQCNGVPAAQYAASQASLNAVLMPSTQGVGHLSVYDGSKPGDIDESHMPYGYFDDERDPEKLGTDAPAGATHQDLETGRFYKSENGAVYVFGVNNWGLHGVTPHDLDVAAHVIRLPIDEPTDADTALCPDVPDSFYAAQTTTPAPPQAVESAAVTVANAADCAPLGQQSNPLEVEGFDEPTESDTGLCPDLPDSFYAVPTPCPMPSIPEVKWGVFIDNGCGTRQAAPSLELANAYCDVLQKVRPDYVGIISVQEWPENETHNPEWFDESYQSCLKDIEKMKNVVATTNPVAVTVEPAPVADPDYAVPVCTLKKTLEPLPSITDNGDLPADFDDSDSGAKLDVIVIMRDNGEHVATTGAGATYVRASSRSSTNAALKNLLKKCKLIVAESAIVETTDDDDRAQQRQRFSIDTSFAEPSDSDMANDEIAYSGHAELPEPVAANPDQIDHDAPAPVSIVTELDLRPFHVLNQLISVQQRNCDPIYSAFFAARGITEGGKLSSKGTRLLAGLSQAEPNERAEQIIKNACDVPETDATYDEIVALINHASTQMQALKLTDRISKHGNFAERQKLFFIQKDRIEALKADSAA